MLHKILNPGGFSGRLSQVSLVFPKPPKRLKIVVSVQQQPPEDYSDRKRVTVNKQQLVVHFPEAFSVHHLPMLNHNNKLVDSLEVNLANSKVEACLAPAVHSKVEGYSAPVVHNSHRHNQVAVFLDH